MNDRTVWALRIVGILAILVCMGCAISFPGIKPEFQLACIVGSGLVLLTLLCRMSVWLWMLTDAGLGFLSFVTIHHAPGDIPSVSLLHLGLYPGVLLGTMAVLVLIGLLQVWAAQQDARKARMNLPHGFLDRF